MSIVHEYWDDYEVLTVETPENLELRLPLAGFGPRFLALLVDTLIQAAAGVVLVALVGALAMTFAGAAQEDAVGMLLLVVILLGMFLVTTGYFILFEVLWNGQTPGKRLAGIRVVRRGGLPLTLRDVLLRNLVRLVDYMPSYCFAGLICFFASKNQQRLGDLVADTVVIREFSSEAPHTWSGDTQFALTDSSSGLPPVLLYAISSYLARTRQLSADARLRLTDEVIRQLSYDGSRLSLRERDGYLAHVLGLVSGARS